MVSILDRSIGDLIKTLNDNKMLENTLIAFYNDNGGPVIGLHSTNASNYPFRGVKAV
jgi:arylsulfatase A-like enzyme